MSQAVAHSSVVYMAGQVADTRSGDPAVQNCAVPAKIDALLKHAGSDRIRLLSVSVFLAHIHDFEAMNAVYDQWVKDSVPPGRVCTEARLADPALRIEVSAVGAAAERSA